MARFIIRGGKPLRGRFVPAGNKNAVLPMLAACLLTDEEITLRNVPLIEDVLTMLELLSGLGVQVSHKDHCVRLCARGLQKRALDRQLCLRVRSSILLSGPLAARHGRATLYPPGGDVIGRRRLDTHFMGLGALGIRVSAGSDCYRFTRGRLEGANILLDEASVTATENVMMAATLASGATVIFNAACEPHVQDLAVLLAKMGARISGIGTNRIEVQGVKSLSGAEHEVCPDHIETGSFLAAAAITGGSLSIPCPDCNAVAPILRPLRTLGLRVTIEDNTHCLAQAKCLRIRNDYGRLIPKIEDGPWPSFPSDLMSAAIVAATQARGSVLFFEKMFESRMYFVDRLIDMGARIIQCDPHRVLVTGHARLHAANVSSPDIRAGMAMVLAALCAKGSSSIANAQVIDRGHERIEERLRLLGADIERDTTAA